MSAEHRFVPEGADARDGDFSLRRQLKFEMATLHQRLESHVEAHGGRIWAECSAGSTRFTFTLPLTR